MDYCWRLSRAPYESKGVMQLRSVSRLALMAGTSVLLASGFTTDVRADDAAGSIDDQRQASVGSFDDQVRPLLSKFCFECHGPELQEGEVGLHDLDADVIGGDDADHWHAALDMINQGYMPPEDAPQPTDSERRLIVDWMTDAIELARKYRTPSSGGKLRRLTREQYTNTLAELLSLPIDFGRNLPDESKSKMGFTNSGDALLTSPLHVDYFQAIAREALSKAIAGDDRPEATRYRVTLGVNVGADGHAAVIGGFQSAPIRSEHVLVEILDGQGQPRVGETPEERAELRQIESNIGIGMRGSSGDRYRIIDDGLLLYSALPHRERAPKSWQGPSPNMKLLLRRCFPSEGPFTVRVVASLARPEDCQQAKGLMELRSNEAIASVDSDDGKLVLPLDATVLKASRCSNVKGLVRSDDLLLPEDVTQESWANFRFHVRQPGYYQIDLVHPQATADAMPSVSLQVKDSAQHLRLPHADADGGDLVVTPLAHGQFDVGRYGLKVGGRFFVGFRDVVVSRMPDDHPVVTSIRNELPEVDERTTGVAALRAFVGTRTDDGMDYAEMDGLQVVDARPDEPTTFEFHGYLENMPIPHSEEPDGTSLSSIMIVGLWNDHLVKNVADRGVPIVVRSIEFEGSAHRSWPPESHTAVFFDSPKRDTDIESYTREVLGRFMSRAFRREVEPSEVDRYVDFWKSIQGECDDYYDGVKEALVAILCSPHFLYLNAPAQDATVEMEVAERLAYFLWNSPPDENLSKLAAAGELQDNLAAQARWMIDDDRVERFVGAFASEWLRLDRHASMDVNIGKYGDYTRFVKRDMASETQQFVLRVLRENMSLMNFVDSDFAMLNQNLAEFYGIDGVQGNHFRPVPITPEMHRGGLLSQGAFLCGHSDGTQAHPIKRAVWLKEKILGSPPPPPPPNVPELDPETPGFEKLTLKQQLELHRNKPSCVDCHRKIDPYGVVFENYDAVGRYQERTKGRPIDAKSELPDGAVVNGVEQLKGYLLENKKAEVTRSVVSHLYSYALGRDATFVDEPEIEQIVARVAADEYRLQTAIIAIIESESFLSTATE